MKKIDEILVLKMYNDGFTMMEISTHFKYKSYTTVRGILLKNNIYLKSQIGSKSRKKKINEDFFTNIDSSEKAYILGWVLSDGYVNKYKLTFCIKDVEILHIIKEKLESEHKISKSIYFDKRQNKSYYRYFLQITSKKIVNSLNDLGIFQSKSFNVKLPKINPEFHSDIIRGIFDGDGYVGVKKNKKDEKSLRFSLIVTETMFNDMTLIFNKLGINLKIPTIVAENDNGKVLKINIYSINDIKQIFNFMYSKNNCLKLERKYNKFKEVFHD